MNFLKTSIVSGLSFFAAVSSYANLQFTVDEFTTDRLTITLLPSELSLFDPGAPSPTRGLALFGYDDQGRFGSTFVPSGSWIIEGVSVSVQETSPGSLGSSAFSPDFSTAQFSTFAGPLISISNGPVDLVDGDTIVSPYQISFFGAGLFNPSAIAGFGLFPGVDNSYNLQSTASFSQIPEPASYVTLLGTVALAATALRRRGKRSERA